MRREGAPLLMIFLHVPKAGGTTLLRVLERLYPGDQAAFVNPLLSVHEGRDEMEELEALDERRRGALRLIAGHMFFGLHRRLERRAGYFTILRDPVERVVSDFRYIQRTPWHLFHGEVAGKKMSLRDYVESGLAPMAENGQVRLLSGEREIPYGGVGEEHLARAKANLEEHFVVAGTLERYDETLVRLRQELGWGMPYYVRARVASGAAPALDDATREALESHNAQDRALYAWVREREEGAIAEAQEEISTDLACLRRACLRHAVWRRYAADPAERMLNQARRWKRRLAKN